MRFKLDVMFALFLGQQYDTLMNGLSKDEATATYVNFTEIKDTVFAKITTLKSSRIYCPTLNDANIIYTLPSRKIAYNTR